MCVQRTRIYGHFILPPFAKIVVRETSLQTLDTQNNYSIITGHKMNNLVSAFFVDNLNMYLFVVHNELALTKKESQD